MLFHPEIEIGSSFFYCNTIRVCLVWILEPAPVGKGFDIKECGFLMFTKLPCQGGFSTLRGTSRAVTGERPRAVISRMR